MTSTTRRCSPSSAACATPSCRPRNSGGSSPMWSRTRRLPSTFCMRTIVRPTCTRARERLARLNLRDLDLADLTAALAGYGIDEAKARRVFAAVHRDGSSAVEPWDWLSNATRAALAADIDFPE